MTLNPYQAPSEEAAPILESLIERSRLWKRRFWLSLRVFTIGLALFVICNYGLWFWADRDDARIYLVLNLIFSLVGLVSLCIWMVTLLLTFVCGVCWGVTSAKAHRIRRNRNDAAGAAK